MSGYQGRHATNVSRFVGLNVMPSPYEMEQQQQDVDEVKFDDIFLDAEWLDSDLQANMPQSVNFDQQLQSRRQSGAGYTGNGDDDILHGDFQIPPSFAYSNSAAGLSNGHNDHFGLQQQLSSPTAASPMSAGSGPSTGSKRKIDSLSEPRAPVSLEEATRMAAEEDKRRRNTAASARFRVKKKQREQALEKTAKDMSDRVSLLEKRVQELEMENKWLKGLITEKNGPSSSLGDMFAKHRKDDVSDSRKEEERNDGVGTKDKAKDDA